ncbi:fluoride efflux transporter FluC [Aeromicrobium sp. CF3.5]|uniref:fluoride efflux transporter FluC n=1 Tax=Aeromicrobium sp. CF3.5 TaxID=3373078 RepID=UPI003EE5131A
MITLAMALAGGVGAVLRYGVDLRLSPPAEARLPHATLTVNLTGSLLLGLLVGAGAGNDTLTVLGTGLLGGYTTFSSASVEVARRVLEGRSADGLLTALVMVVGCVALASAGVAAGRVL